MKARLKIQKRNLKQRVLQSSRYILIFSFVGFFAVAIFFVFQGRYILVHYEAPVVEETKSNTPEIAPFPVGVDRNKKEIIENPLVETYFDEHVTSKSDYTGAHTSWLGRALGKLALFEWYQNLASLTTRILIIQSGERKEQITDNFEKILGWDKAERADFLQQIDESVPMIADGKFFPGTYVSSREATPEDIAKLVHDRFSTEVLSRYGSDIELKVPLQDTLTIASLLEREAYDFNDMRQISGVIWNRLFVDMKLQIDATLQYAKGSKPNERWWPSVIPSDKYIASVYNTYKNSGLPPSPIANPSLEAIIAALNPRKTDCMYYFHDKQAGFHCNVTYEEHVASLKQYYGRGK